MCDTVCTRCVVWMQVEGVRVVFRGDHPRSGAAVTSMADFAEGTEFTLDLLR